MVVGPKTRHCSYQYLRRTLVLVNLLQYGVYDGTVVVELIGRMKPLLRVFLRPKATPRRVWDSSSRSFCTARACHQGAEMHSNMGFQSSFTAQISPWACYILIHLLQILSSKVCNAPRSRLLLLNLLSVGK